MAQADKVTEITAKVAVNFFIFNALNEVVLGGSEGFVALMPIY